MSDPRSPPPAGTGPYNPQGPVAWQASSTFPQFQQSIQSIAQSLQGILGLLQQGGLTSTVPTLTFAQLPSAVGLGGRMFFVSNARKPGEGPGSGSGNMVFSDGSQWYTMAGVLASA